MLTTGVINRCRHQRWPQQHLVVECVGGRVVREVIEQGPQNGGPAPRRLPEERVEIREQPVAQPQELAANSLDARAETPGLVALGTGQRVAAAKGRQGTELHPAGEQLAASVAEEAANVGADER